MSDKYATGWVFLHGGFHGGWCWDRLRSQIVGESCAIDLPGRNASPAELATITYEDWVESATAQAAKLEAPNLILVGHSLAGITLPQVAARLKERVRALVLVAAVIPPEGWTFRQANNVDIPSDFWPVPPKAICDQLLFGELNEDEANSLYKKLSAEPAGPLVTPISRRGLPALPITYIRAQQDLTGLGLPEVERLRADYPEVALVEMPGDHNVIIARAAQVAATLNQVLASCEVA